MRTAGHFLKTHKAVDIALLILVPLVAARGWLAPGFPQGHDAVGDMLVAQAAKALLSQGGVVPGWTEQWFLGYPMFYVHPPLPHILLLILSFPLGWAVAVKVLYFLFFALSGVFAYFYIYELTRNRYASFISGLLYTFIPFHLVEVVFEGHQGAIGMPYMLTPLVFLSAERAVKNPSAKKVIVSGILLAALVLTYPQIFLMLIGPFLGLYAVFRIWIESKNRRNVRTAIFVWAGIFSLGLLLSAFWWFPLLGEINNFHATRFPLEAARAFSATVTQALSLRPYLDCAPSSAFAAAGSTLVPLQLFPALLALLGIVFNRRNKYVWFFSLAVLAIIFLAMGLRSPLNIYGFAYEHLPFFAGLRTPQRFLLFASFAYAVLAGFAVKSIADWLKRPKLLLTMVFLLSLLVVANTWQESGRAFATFQLTSDEQEAIRWLAEQEDGRVMTIPLETYVSSAERGHIVNPMYYLWLHKKETVWGGVPAAAPRWTGDFLDSVYWTAQERTIEIGEMSDVLGVKYAVVDKRTPAYINYVLDKSFRLAWQSETIDIYEHQDPYPRVFALPSVNGDTENIESDNGTFRLPADSGRIEKVEFYRIHPGKYKVIINSSQPLLLVLTDSYYPGWVAEIEGESITSERAYQFLNSWRIDKTGSSEVILEFTESWQRKTGRVISWLTLGGVLLFLWGKVVLSRRLRRVKI